MKASHLDLSVFVRLFVCNLVGRTNKSYNLAGAFDSMTSLLEHSQQNADFCKKNDLGQIVF